MTEILFQQEAQSFSCSCGSVHHIRTGKTILGVDVLSYLPQILKEMELGRRVLLVFDANTYKAAGNDVEHELQRKGFAVTPCLLQKKPGLFYLEPDEDARAQIGEHLRTNPEVLVAVGSGVISDLVKFIAHRVSLPFVVVATAPSMDGYPSPGAPMMVSGYKVTYEATPPRAIIADLRVLSQAPLPLIHAGFLDLLGKAIANADWIMRHVFYQEDFCETIWQITRENLSRVIAEGTNLIQRNPKAIYELTVALLNSGFGMDMIGDSRPASGAEHLIAHYLEIMALHRSMDPSLHGLRVGTATVLMHRIYQRFLEEMSSLNWEGQAPPLSERLERLKLHFGPLFPLVEDVAREKLTMTVPPVIRDKHFQEQLKEAIQRKLLVVPDPLTVLRSAQAPQGLSDLGFSPKMTREALLFARFLRKRVTLPDLLDQVGVLEEYVDWVLQETNEEDKTG